MKVLFVCRANVGRSQMACALFTKSTGLKAESAGTKVDLSKGLRVKDFGELAEPVIRFMRKEGINVAEKTRRQITLEMIRKFDKIIVMAEPETIPDPSQYF